MDKFNSIVNQFGYSSIACAVSIIIILILYVKICLLKRDNGKVKNVLAKVMRPPVVLNYDQDIMFIDKMIDDKVINVVSLRFKPKLQQTKMAMVHDSDIAKYTEEIATDVMRTISPVYVEVLCKYFDGREEIANYVSEKTLNYMSELSIKINSSQLSKMS